VSVSPAKAEQGDALSCFSSHAVKNSPFLSLFNAMFFMYFFFGDFIVQMAPQL
jgi:hypothetical protein